MSLVWSNEFVMEYVLYTLLCTANLQAEEKKYIEPFFLDTARNTKRVPNHNDLFCNLDWIVLMVICTEYN